jgi:hypothetical protein
MERGSQNRDMDLLVAADCDPMIEKYHSDEFFQKSKLWSSISLRKLRAVGGARIQTQVGRHFFFCTSKIKCKDEVLINNTSSIAS